MDNCEIIKITGNIIYCVCLTTGQTFEVKLNG
jgi:hypothetical protein